MEISSGITISIYDNNGNPNNGGRQYIIPGPKVLSCASGRETLARGRYAVKRREE